ncbi:MAG TPA: LolA-related protein [Steroidobacteraceae bacterium]
MKRRADYVGVLAAVGFAATCAAAPESTPQPAFEQVLQLLAARRHGHVTFTEVHELALLDRPLQSSGELLYAAPDRLEKRTLKPKAETLVLEQGVLRARRGRRTYVMQLRDYPQVVPFVESIRATLAGDRAALERYFRVEFDGSLAQWTLLLVPVDASLAAAVKDIRIEGERDAIRAVQIRQSDGDRSLLTIGPEVTP